VFEKGELSAAAAGIDARIGGRIARLVKRGDMHGKTGDLLVLADVSGAACERVVLVGLGARKNLRRKQYRKALTAALAAVARTGARDVVSYLSLEAVGDADSYTLARIAAEVAGHTAYRIPDQKTSNKRPKSTLTRFGIAAGARGDKTQAERGLEHGRGIVAGMSLMRDLANLAPNVCTPTYLAGAAKTLAREHRSIRAQVLNEVDCRKLKMGSFLSVTAGTEQPAKLIVLEYRGGKRGDAPIALVGKGVTFDTGGISLKPPPAMDEMKFDMCGAASVLGTLKAVAAMKLPLNVVGLIPATENMPSGNATAMISAISPSSSAETSARVNPSTRRLASSQVRSASAMRALL